MNRLRFAAALLCAALLSGCVTTEVKTALEAGDSGSIAFPMKSYWKGREVTAGIGSLAFPSDGAEKAPLVVLVHGSKGVGYREATWAGFLRDQGYATFMLDYFAPRGASSKSRDVPRPPQDVWAALRLLSTHPRLDMDRVAVMGFSNGASVTLGSVGGNPKTDTNGVLPKAFVMVYGGCHTPANPYSRDYRPALLYIVGDDDNLIRSGDCEQRARDPGAENAETMVIAGATHMFDGNRSGSFRHPKWGVVTTRADSGATAKARRKVVELLDRVM